MVVTYDSRRANVASCGYSLGMDDKPKTIKDAANEVNVPIGTVRQWVKDFAHTGAFSKKAVPGLGKTRLFTDEDLVVLLTIKVKRADRETTAEIAESLANGDRFYPQPEPAPASSPGDNQTAENDTQEPQQAIEVYQAFKTTIESYERQIEGKEARINELTERLIDAESRAAAAEAQIDNKRVGWFDKLLGRG